MIKQVLLLCVILAHAANAQPVSFGVKAGVPLTDPALYQDQSRPYVIGPSTEVRLPVGFALEASALYQRIGTSAFYPQIVAIAVVRTGPFTLGSLTSRTRANSWEFPLLGEYYAGRCQRCGEHIIVPHR